MNTQILLNQYFETAFSAPDGIKRLRELILSLAMQGKLVPQDPRDQPARELLQEIEEKQKEFLEKKKVKYSKVSENPDIAKMKFKIPDSWEWSLFKDVSFFQEGPGIRKWQFTHEGVKLLNVSNILSNNSLDFDNSDKFVSLEEFLEKYSHFEIEKGDLLFASSGGSWGKISWYEDPGFRVMLNTSTIRLRFFDERFDKNYLFYFLKTQFFRKQMEIQLVGMQPNFGSTHLSRIYIPIPPLAEQKRIVEKIDRLMAQCDELEKQQQEREQKRILVHISAIQKLLNAPEEKTFGDAWQFIKQNFGELYAVKENVSELRKAILQLAVMGKLVPQDPNDPPASELLKEIEAEKQRLIKEGKIKKQKPLPEITSDEIPYNLPSGWSVARFQTITKVITCGIASTPNYYDKGRIFLSAKNVKPYKFMPKNHKLIDEETYQKIIANAKPEKGDILMTRVGAGIGESAIIDQDIEFAYYVSLTLIKPFLNFLDSFYLLHFLNSEYGIKNAISQTTGIGASQGNLNVNSIRPYVIPIPPLPEQHRIVAKVDALMALCDQLENQIDQQTTKQTQLLEAVMAGV